MILMYRGKPIEPYETFNWHDSEAFAKGSFGGGDFPHHQMWKLHSNYGGGL